MTNSVFKTIMNIIWRIIQIILLFVLVGGIIAVTLGTMLGISMVEVAKSSPKVNPKNIVLSLDQNSKIYDRDGNLMESIAYEEYREVVKYEDIPKGLINATLALEDERFFEHEGVDLRSIGRSIRDNLRAGDIVQGGSTITQQLIKNVYLTNEVAWERKITEMYLALQVEKQISKEDILEAYLNRVFFGQHAYGAQVASNTYFSKDLSELNNAQFASLAAIVQSPNAYALFKTYSPASVPADEKVIGDYKILGYDFVAVENDRVLDRQKRALSNMHELGMLTDKEYEDAINFDLLASIKPSSKVTEYPSHISTMIKNQAIDFIMDSQDIDRDSARNLLYTGGLSITTTIDWDLQAKLEETYNDFANIFSDKNGGGRQPLLGSLDFDEYDDIVDADSNAKLYYKKENLVTEDSRIYVPEGWYEITESGDFINKSSRLRLNGGNINILPFYTKNENNELVTHRVGSIQIPEEYTDTYEGGGFIISADFFKNVDDFYTIENGNLVINPSYYSIESIGTVQPQSATVILDAHTAEVVAVASERGESPDDSINRATDYNRSPASSLKPVSVYGPVIEEGRTLADPVDDSPRAMLNDNPWPRNVDGKFRGIQTTRDALFLSTNPTAVELLQNELGFEKAKEYLAKFGIINEEHPERDNFITAEENPNTNDENPSMAIGGFTKGLTPMDLVSAFQTFANYGERVESSIISEITSEELGVIYKNEHKPIKVLSEETSFLVSDVMHEIANRSFVVGNTGNGDMWTAGKTGTSNSNVDFWFNAFNPYYVASTWIGFDNQRLEMEGNSGIASRLYYSYMNKMIEGKEDTGYPMPADIVEEEVSKTDGLLATELTKRDPRGSQAYTEYFKAGTEPTTQSTAHVELGVDSRNNLLAPRNFPLYLTERKVFVNRPLPYDPDEFDGIVPDDYNLQAPTAYSNLRIVERTTTQVLANGTVVETTTKTNGNIEVRRTYPDGSGLLQITTPNGNVTTTVIPAPIVETQAETPQETQAETPPETQAETPRETQAETPQETTPEPAPEPPAQDDAA